MGDASNRSRTPLQRYWRGNLRVMLVLLAGWAAASLGAGVLAADVLNRAQFLGFPLGFWFAQQGSIVAFLVLILVYAAWMNRLDRRHHRERRAASRDASS